MRNGKLFAGVCILVCVSLVSTGCQTATGSAVGGSAVGAGLGAVIGHQSGHAGEGALIGGLVGGLAGVAIHDAKKSRTREETVAYKNYTPEQGAVLDIERSAVSPGSVRPGDKVSITMEYSLLGTGSGGARVQERRTLTKDGQVVLELSSETFTRDEGTWISTMEYTIPRDLGPGAYELVQTAKTESPPVTVKSSTTFYVTG